MHGARFWREFALILRRFDIPLEQASTHPGYVRHALRGQREPESTYVRAA